ncbi:unnamed protein product [Urochloa decumbens]|uniref:HECT-type E3 ubiquitin transferase n=1 Tax=Urochloa decumbens TaxID=240449 RepID=A0ABC9C204_9POAL
MAPPAAAAASEPGSSSSGAVQLLLRNLDSHTTVIRAQRDDTLDSVLHRLWKGIAHRGDLHITYAGRELPRGATVGELGLPRDATLHVSSRLRSTPYPDAWRLASEIAAAAAATARGGGRAPREKKEEVTLLDNLVRSFLDLAQAAHEKDSPGGAVPVGDHLDIFLRSGAPVLLAQRYLSDHQPPRRAEAERAMRCFLSADPVVKVWTAPVLMELCRCIAAGERRHDQGDTLYFDLRCVLASVLSHPDWTPAWWLGAPPKRVAEEVDRLAGETARALVEEIAGAYGGHATAVPAACRNLAGLSVEVEFRIFWSVLRKMVLELDSDSDTKHLPWRMGLSETLVSLLRSVDECMARFEATLPRPPPTWTASLHAVWAVLAELDAWSQQDAWWVLRRALRATVAEHATAATALVMSAGRELRLNGGWIARHRDILPFEARRYLAMAMLPELVAGVDAPPPFEMLIDRSRLLPDSFGYVANATPRELCAELDVAFKDEEAAGPGVLREWFCLVCQALFSRDVVLFSACPRDRRRFFVNPTSVVDPRHLEYFEFAGRIFALALMHKIHVGVFFDRTLFLRLAGRPISLDDIADADPDLYNSCQKILEMDPSLVDSNVLGLTFVREVEVVGSRTITELFQGGKDVVVTSENRGHYISLLIQDRFVNSTRYQLNHFIAGFSSLFDRGKLWTKFFESLDAADFDRMLGGNSNDTIDVKEWRAYTDYHGYKENDRQIKWFWEAVENMTVEEQRRLLFFWTSVKYLPSDGFSGLDCSKLFIYRVSSSRDHLPTSQTCFYHLNLPAYSSSSMMHSRLQRIVQEHVSSGFGAA